MTAWLNEVREGFLRLGADEASAGSALTALAAWLEDDGHAADRAQLQGLAARGRHDELLDAFVRPLPFGTSGRRGPVGFGPNRLNPTTLGAAVQAHAELLSEARSDEPGLVVVAFDVRVFRDRARRFDPALPNPLLGLRSADLAVAAAEIYVAHGLRVAMPDPAGDRYLSTPMTSLAVRRRHAVGGLVVTASHNPPDDNGGKFYDAAGSQPVPPHDERLASRAARAGRLRRVPFAEARADGLVHLVGDEDADHYRAVLGRLVAAPSRRSFPVVFTPLHGTTGRTLPRLLTDAGLDVHRVEAQARPDGAFPTLGDVPPNPERPECFAAAARRADEVGAHLLLAADPDGDRLGVQVRRPGGAWRFVDGQQQVLLLLRTVLAARREAGGLPPRAFVLTTKVTSRLVGTIARSHGCRLVDDLPTGCRFMAAVLAALESTGRWGGLEARPADLVLAAEESHGVLLTPAIREKDAGGPALVLAGLAARCAGEGRSLLDELDALHARFGVVAHRAAGLAVPGPTGRARVAASLARLRAAPPGSVADRAVTAVEDLADPRGPGGPVRSPGDAAARDLLVLRLSGGARVAVRPSGTEPKLKLYVEVPGRTPEHDLRPDELAAEWSAADAAADALAAAWTARLGEWTAGSPSG